MKAINVFTGSTGLNTIYDPVRIFDSQEGIKDLAAAADVDITDTGRISRRKGRTLRLAGNFSDGFCDGGQCLVVSGTNLCVLNNDYTTTAIGTVTAGARLSCCQVGDRIYFCNGYEKGYVENSVVKEWVKGEYTGPPTNRIFSDPPIGTLVELYRFRMYVAQNEMLFFSEPGEFGDFHLSGGYSEYSTKISMLKAVKNGIFLSTANNTYFLSGKTPEKFEEVLVAPYPAIQGTAVKARYVFEGSSQEGSQRLTPSGNQCILWMSQYGICYGGPDGTFENLTEKKIKGIPTGLTGAGIVANNRYIGLIEG